MATTCRREQITVKRVKSVEEAITVAAIRNECRRYLTGNRQPIGVVEQTAFYRRLPKSWGLFLVRWRDSEPCGYALIRPENGELCLTGCLVKEARGFGLGRRLFQTLVNITKGKCVLNVLRSNKRAVKLYLSLGFKPYRSTAKLIYMRYDRHSTS